MANETAESAYTDGYLSARCSGATLDELLMFHALADVAVAEVTGILAPPRPTPPHPLNRSTGTLLT